MNSSVRSFGVMPDGSGVAMISLETGSMRAEFIGLGAAIRSLWVKDRRGQWTDVVLGYDTLEEYASNGGNLGACVGRHANRIGGGKFTLNGVTYALCCNNGPNHLHGGPHGFDQRVWTHELLPDGVRFRLVSPDGDQGYPGTLTAAVTYRLLPDARLDIAYEARSDRDTLCNLTNHSYFNLDGSVDILGHILSVDADSFTENDENCLPTGRILPAAGTPFDFRSPKAVGRDINAPDPQLQPFGGYDHNFVISGAGYRHAARLSSPESGIVMDVFTTTPGMQVYTANSLAPCRGMNGAEYGRYSGICLETQFFPNAMACDGFEKPILRAGDVWRQETAFEFPVLE